MIQKQQYTQANELLLLLVSLFGENPEIATLGLIDQYHFMFISF